MSITVSVVVPTFRREELLRKCLECLLEQTFPAANYEIIVCDDGPSPATRELVEQMAADTTTSVRYFPICNTQGPAAARNVGWQAAVGEVIAFTDDDCQPTPGWLMAGVTMLIDADAAAVTGATVVPLPKHPTDHELDTAGLATAEFITANCFCRRQVLAEIGGFDERFTRAWREDSDLHFSLLERGELIVPSPAAIVIHPVRSAPWGMSLRQQSKGMFDVLLQRKHPALYRQKIHPYPRLYLFIAATGIISAVSLMMQWSAGIKMGLIFWSLATAYFAAKRLQHTSRRLSHIWEMGITSAIIPILSLYWQLVGWWRFGRAQPQMHQGKRLEELFPATAEEFLQSEEKSSENTTSDSSPFARC